MTIHDFPQPRSWNAEWVWAPGDGREKNAYCYFRTEVHLAEPPDDARLFIAADTRYRLYVNGVYVGRGAPPSQPFFLYYDEHPVGALLRPGTNCIAAVVCHVGNLTDTRGGLLAELVGGDGPPLAATSADWRVARAAAWRANTFCVRSNQVTPYQEFYDARLAPVGWTAPGFDDSEWGRAAVVPDNARPWTRLVPRDIPFMDETPLLPAHIESVEECLEIANRPRGDDLSIALSAHGLPLHHARVDGPECLLSNEGVTTVQCSTDHLDRVADGIYDPCILLDFGRVVTAFIELDLEGPAGGIVDVGYAERLIDGRFNNAIECSFADRYTMAEGRQTFRAFAWKGFRYAKLRFWSCAQPVRIHAARAIVSQYPFAERGGFRSSDPQLNAVFDISRATLRLCANEQLTDTPWREQAQWLGDVSAVTLGGIYACFGDPRLPAKFLRQSAENQLPTGLIANVTNTVSFGWRRVIPDYSLWWIIALWNHYRYTGQERWVHHFYPQAGRIVQAFLNHLGHNGLVADMPYWLLIDWADVDRRGECAPLNAIFYAALDAFARMARLKGDSHAAERAEAVRAGIRRSFVPRLFDEARGCFADANVRGQLSPKTSEHANAAAIWAGLCDDPLAHRIVRTLYEDEALPFTEAQPFFTTFVLQALDRIGRFDLALRIIHERWGRRMVDRGATSTYEEWGINGSWRSGTYQGFLRSLSHAWSAHPAEFLIRNLIGLDILEPGCRRVRLDPRPVPFDYAVTFPTPQGPIVVRKHGQDVTTKLPDGIELGS